MTLRQEFKDTIDKLVRYCREKNHLSGNCGYDADSFADGLVRINAK